MFVRCIIHTRLNSFPEPTVQRLIHLNGVFDETAVLDTLIE